MRDLDRFVGCLVGGAAGDALGYAVEFMLADEIFKKYGDVGITAYDLVSGVAQISDDTQMTLFTADGLLLGKKNANYLGQIRECYLDWMKTQTTEEFGLCEDFVSRLYQVPELHHERAPGRTCVNALMHGAKGTIEAPINCSKGCGGIMRVAPVGLFFDDEKTPKEIAWLAAEAAAITHGHELGYIPAAAFAHMVHSLAYGKVNSIADATRNAIADMTDLFLDAEHLPDLIATMERALELSSAGLDDLDAIRELGEGWVAEETLSIAIYCAAKYEHDFERAIIASVNHDGDSDSTGAVTGNLLGAALGRKAIPEKFTRNLELLNVIEQMATELWNQ